MNRDHLQAFLWLQWRLRINQLKRGGTTNAVLLALLAAGAVLTGGIAFLVFFIVGLFALAEASPPVVMYLWDGVVIAFLFCWIIGLASDLQRSEALSLDKFLHLPVSVSGVFFLNYLSSLFSFNLIVFVPAMVGLSLGLLFSKGPTMLLLFPVVAGFLLMVTALTYQFQGWLASLMANKRRRRTIVFLVTMLLALIVQLPNLLNLWGPWRSRGDESRQVVKNQETELQRQLVEKKITIADYQKKRDEMMRKFETESQERKQHSGQQIEQAFRLGNVVLPPGWLPLGATGLAEGNPLPALLGFLGMGCLGALSLWRAYRTTLRLYTGQFTSGKIGSAAAAQRAQPPLVKTSDGFLEKKLPWVPEQAAVIALAGFRSLWRAPEAKMLLLSPLIMVVIFGGMFLRGPMNVPELLRPLLAFGGMAILLFTMVQLIGNQFGFDRSGFRVFVLCPAPRRDILLGKNLAVAPFVLTLGAIIACVIQVVMPTRMDLFLAVLLQLSSMYMLFCLLANVVSILAPMRIAAGTLRPTNTKAIPILLHFVLVLLLPPVLSPVLLPWALEATLEAMGVLHGIPLCLILTLMEVSGIFFVYRFVLKWEGELLQAREQKILEAVVTKTE